MSFVDPGSADRIKTKGQERGLFFSFAKKTRNRLKSRPSAKFIMPKPKKIIVNHGESSRCLDLASSVHKQFKIETASPRNLEALRVK